MTPFIISLIGIDGDAASGGLLYSYVRGTTTPRTLYTDSGGATPASNPAVANASGTLTVYFDDALEYSWTAKSSNGADILWQADVVGGVLTFTYLAPLAVSYDVGRINVRNFEIVNQTDWTDAITLATAAAYASGKALWFPADDENYVTDCHNFTSAINIILDKGATVKLKNSATLDGANLYIFRLRASNSSIVGGTFDFNRDGQDRAAFNTAGGSAVRNYYGVRVLGTLATHIENVKIHTKVINCADFGVALQYCDNYDVDVDVETSGCGLIFVDCDGGVCRRARLSELDNADWEVYPHAFDGLNCDGGQWDNIEIVNQSGYDIASGNSLSDWFTGITIADCDNLSGSNWYVVAKSDTSMTKSVGISMLGVTKSSFANITVKRYTSVNLELGALDNCDFANVFLDGEYMTTSLFAAEAQMGCHVVNQGLYSNLTSRIRRPVMNCTFTNVQSVRMLSKGLLVYLATDCQWIGGKFNGNQYGVDIRSDSVNGSFPTPETQTSARLKFLGVEAKFNEIAGIWNGGSTDLECADCDFSNNGQAANAVGDALRLTGTLAVATSGYYGNNSATTVARTRPRLIGCTFQDDQTVTTSFGSVDPAAPTIVSVERPELYQFGQTVTVNNGATGPVDLIAQVLDINNDELTLSAAMTNFPLVAGTGTISTSSTAVTGSLTAFTTQITGRMWIKNGSNYRRVIAVTSNTAATLESAFPSNLSGASYDIVKTEVELMRSQDYGIYTLSGANDAAVRIVDPKWGAGNKLGNISAAGTIVVGEEDRLTPQHFGAIADGTNDDTAAINAAIAYLIARGVNANKELYFPKGDYKVTSALTSFTGSRWNVYGQGMSSRVFASGYNGDIFSFDITGATSTNNALRGMWIEGPSSGAFTSAVGIHVKASAAANFRFDHCMFEDLWFRYLNDAILLDDPYKQAYSGFDQIGNYFAHRYAGIQCQATGANNLQYGIRFAGASGAHHHFADNQIAAAVSGLKMGDGGTNTAVGDQTIVGGYYVAGTYPIHLIGPSGAGRYNRNVRIWGIQIDGSGITNTYRFENMTDCGIIQHSTLQSVDGQLINCGLIEHGPRATNRNLLANGDLRIWQRGTSFVPGASLNMADGYRGRRASTASGSTYSRQTGFNDAQYCMRVQRDSGNAGTDNLFVWRQVDTADVITLQGQYVRFSVDLRAGANFSSASSNISILIFTGTGTDEVVSPSTGFATGNSTILTESKAITTTGTRYSFTSAFVPVDATELAIVLLYTPVGTAGANDYFEHTKWKLEHGNAASEFVSNSFADDLRWAQRRYQKSFNLATTPTTNAGAATGEETFIATVAGANTNRSHRIKFHPPMRGVPGMTLFNPEAASAQVRDQTAAANCTSAATANITETGFHITTTAAAGTTVGGVLAVHWTADAEID